MTFYTVIQTLAQIEDCSSLIGLGLGIASQAIPSNESFLLRAVPTRKAQTGARGAGQSGRPKVDPLALLRFDAPIGSAGVTVNDDDYLTATLLLTEPVTESVAFRSPICHRSVGWRGANCRSGCGC